MTRFLTRGLLLALAALFLASCGGGGDDAISLPGVSGYSLSVATVDSATSLPTTATSAAAPMRVEATLLAPDGVTPVVGATVHFSATVGSLGGATAQTDGAGIASVILNAGSGGAAVGSVTVTFTDPSANVASDSATVSTAGDESSSSGGGTGGGGSTATNVLRMVLSARDGAGSLISATNPVTALNPGRLIATVTLDGVPVDLALVTFTAPSVASLSQSSTATASGVAEVAISPVSSGAGIATASATYNGQTVTGSVVVVTSVVATAPVTLKLGSFNGPTFTNSTLLSSATGAIQSGSTITISADVVDSTNTLYTTPVPISFTSDCASLSTPTATIDATGTTVGGHTSVTYRPTGCAGTDTIRATLVSGTQTLTATTTVSITPASVGQIAFISAAPETIALQGTGGLGRLTRSEVTFRVLGDDGNPIGNQLVCFALSTSVGGLSATSSGKTNASGDVIAVVQSGSIPTSVRVNATVDSDNDSNCATVPSPAKSAVSDALTVSTGLPDQDSFSLSLETINPNAYDHDGVEVGVTVYAADHFHNPVPDGTAISFWSELGSIEPSCTTTNGTCSVKWRSQAPRDNMYPHDLTPGATLNDRRGRAVIMAYAVGEESFDDDNGNGRYDVGEPYTDLPEAVKDSNGNGVRDTPNRLADGFRNEEFVDFDHDFTFDAANGRFDGVLCATGLSTAQCSGDATVNVRDYATLIMSTDSVNIYILHPSVDLSGVDYDNAGLITGVTEPVDANYTFTGQEVTSVNISDGVSRSVRVLVTDLNGNAPAAGTTVKAEVDVGEAGSITGPSNYTVPNMTEAFSATFTVKPPSAGTTPSDGQLIITVESGGVLSSARVNIDATP